MAKQIQGLGDNRKKVCPNCGREFYIFNKLMPYTYQIKRKSGAIYYCSYKCVNEALEKEKEDGRKSYLTVD